MTLLNTICFYLAILKEDFVLVKYLLERHVIDASKKLAISWKPPSECKEHLLKGRLISTGCLFVLTSSIELI